MTECFIKVTADTAGICNGIPYSYLAEFNDWIALELAEYMKTVNADTVLFIEYR